MSTEFCRHRGWSPTKKWHRRGAAMLAAMQRLAARDAEGVTLVVAVEPNVPAWPSEGA